MDSANLVTEFLNTLNIPESGKCGYNESSTSQVSLTELCKKLGLKVSGENSSKVVSYAASIEILQHVADIGSSLGNIDFSGIALAPLLLIRDLEKLKDACEQPELRDFLGFTKDFFEQALADLKSGNVDAALINLVQLNHQAKKALSFPVTGAKIFILTQLLILSDVLLASALPSSKGTVIIPPSRLSTKQRKTISNRVIKHCDKAFKGLEKRRDSYIGSSGLKKMLSIDPDEQEMKNKELEQARQKLLKVMFPLLYATTEATKDEKLKVFIPDRSLIPSGKEVSHIRFETPSGSQDFLWVWVEDKMPCINLVYKNIEYVYTPTETDEENIIVTMENDKIVSGNHGTVKNIKDYHTMSLVKPSNEELHHFITLAFTGAITYMDEVWLHSEFVSADYAISAAPLLGITRSVLLQGFSFNSENWNSSVKSNVQKETKLFHLRDCNVGKNCCVSVAELCRKAKVAELEDVYFEDFTKFSKAFLKKEDPEECQMIWFWNETVIKHRHEILQFSKRLGWRVCRNTEEDITIVRYASQL